MKSTSRKSSTSVKRKTGDKITKTNQEDFTEDEIVFGLVAFVGADLDAFEEQLNLHLPKYSY